MSTSINAGMIEDAIATFVHLFNRGEYEKASWIYAEDAVLIEDGLLNRGRAQVLGAAQEQNNFIKTHEVRLCQINEAGNLALVWCDYEIIHQTDDGPCVTYSGCSTLNFSLTETGLLIIADTGMIHRQSN